MRALRAFTVAVLALGLIAAACGSGGGSESPAQAKAKITTAWQNFFDPAVPLAQKKNLVENYNALLPILQQQQNNPAAQGIKAKVSYDIANAQTGEALLPNASGDAVKQDGKWKVSQFTFCQLLALGGGKC